MSFPMIKLVFPFDNMRCAVFFHLKYFSSYQWRHSSYPFIYRKNSALHIYQISRGQCITYNYFISLTITHKAYIFFNDLPECTEDQELQQQSVQQRQVNWWLLQAHHHQSCLLALSQAPPLPSGTGENHPQFRQSTQSLNLKIKSMSYFVHRSTSQVTWYQFQFRREQYEAMLALFTLTQAKKNILLYPCGVRLTQF